MDVEAAGHFRMQCLHLASKRSEDHRAAPKTTEEVLAEAQKFADFVIGKPE